MNALKTIISRIYQSKSIDPDVSDEDLSNTSKVLNQLGISVRDVTGAYRPLNDILKDIQEKEKGLTDTQKANISYQAAGVRQSNIFAVSLDTITKSQTLANEATKSNGELLNANSKYMDTVTAKWKSLGATMTAIFQNAINTDVIKNGIVVLTSFANGAGAVVSKLGLLPTILTTVGIAMTLLNTKFQLFKVSMNAEGIVQFGGKLSGLITSIQNYKMQLSLLKLEQAQYNEQGLLMVNNTTTMGMRFQALTGKTIAQTVATAACTVASVALNAALTMGLSFAITGIVTAISNWIGASEKARQEQEQLQQEISQVSDNLKNSIKSYEDVNDLLQQQQDILSKGSNKQTIEEKQKLHDIEVQLAQAIPEATTKYDSENKALADNLDLTKQLNQAKKEEAIANAQKIIGSVDTNKEVDDLKRIKDAMTEINKARNSQQTEDNFVSSMGNIYNATKGIIPEADSKTLANTNDWTDLNKKLFIILSDLNTEQQKDTKTLTDYNSAVDYYNKQTGESIKTVNDKILATSNDTKVTNDNTQSKQQNIIEIETQTKDLSDLQKAFDTSTEKGLGYDKILVELNKNHTLSASTIKEIIKSYPELESHIGNEADMRKKLSSLLEDQKNKEKQAYYEMMASDTEFYNTQIKNSDNAITQKAKAYNIDMDNCKNVAEVKAKIDEQLIKTLGTMWGEYYSINADGMASLNKSYSDLMNGYLNNSGVPDEAKTSIRNSLNSVTADMDAYNAKVKAISDSFKDVVVKVGGVDFDSLNNSNAAEDIKNAEKAAKEAAKEDPEKVNDLDLKIDRYTTLNDILTEINNQLDLMSKEESQATKNEDKIKYLKQEVDLYNQKRTALINLQDAINNRRSTIISDETSNGFQFGANGEILNYESQMQALIDNANSQSSADAKKKAQDAVKAIDDEMKEYIDLTFTKLPDIEKQWQDVGVAIATVNQDIEKMTLDTVELNKKTYDDMVSKVTDAIKKNTDVQKTAIDNTYNLLDKRVNDQIKLLDAEISKENQLKSAREDVAKVNDIQGQITQLGNDTSYEAQKKRADLEKQLKEAKVTQQTNLNQTNVDNIKSDLQNMLNTEKDKADKEKALVDNTITDVNMKILAQQAIADGYYKDANGNIITLIKLFSDLGETIDTNLLKNLETATGVANGTLQKDVSNHIYGNSVDIANAKDAFGDTYKYTDITQDSNWQNEIGKNDIFVGGTGVASDSSINGAFRIAGQDRNYTNNLMRYVAQNLDSIVPNISDITPNINMSPVNIPTLNSANTQPTINNPMFNFNFDKVVANDSNSVKNVSEKIMGNILGGLRQTGINF